MQLIHSIYTFFSLTNLLQGQDFTIKSGIAIDTKLNENIIKYPYPVEYNPKVGFVVRLDLDYDLSDDVCLFNFLGVRFRHGEINKIAKGLDFNNNIIYDETTYNFLYSEAGIGLKINFYLIDKIIISPIAGTYLRIRMYESRNYIYNIEAISFPIEGREFEDNIIGLVGFAGLQADYQNYSIELSISPELYDSLIKRVGLYKQLSFNFLIGYKF